MSRSPGREAKQKPEWGSLRELGSGDHLEENKRLWVILSLAQCSLGPVGPTDRVGSVWLCRQTLGLRPLLHPELAT